MTPSIGILVADDHAVMRSGLRLLLVAQGFTNKQIADQLLLSVKTVESYRARLMSKLSLKDRSELTRFVLETGLVGKLENP